MFQFLQMMLNIGKYTYKLQHITQWYCEFVAHL